VLTVNCSLQIPVVTFTYFHTHIFFSANKTIHFTLVFCKKIVPYKAASQYGKLSSLRVLQVTDLMQQDMVAVSCHRHHPWQSFQLEQDCRSQSWTETVSHRRCTPLPTPAAKLYRYSTHFNMQTNTARGLNHMGSQNRSMQTNTARGLNHMEVPELMLLIFYIGNLSYHQATQTELKLKTKNTA